MRRWGVAAAVALVAIAVVAGVLLHHPAPLTAKGLRAPFAQGVLAPVADSGPEADRAAVRRAALDVRTEENRAFVVDTSFRHRAPSEVEAALLGPTVAGLRRALIGRARSAVLARRLEHAVVFVVHEEFGPDWTVDGSRADWLDQEVWASSAFHVDRWQGVQVAGDTARVMVRGEDRGTSWSGRPKRDGWAQYQLILRRSSTAPHGWRLVREQAASTAA